MLYEVITGFELGDGTSQIMKTVARGLAHHRRQAKLAHACGLGLGHRDARDRVVGEQVLGTLVVLGQLLLMSGYAVDPQTGLVTLEARNNFV